MNTHAQTICAWIQLTIGRWDKSEAGSSDMNFQGPISQRHFLYVGYTYLEWLLTPLGLNTPHAAAAQLMKHIAYFMGHRLFIYIYYPSQLCFSFPHLACPRLSLPCHSNFLFLHFFPPLLFSVAKGKKNKAFPYFSIYHHIKSLFMFLPFSVGS